MSILLVYWNDDVDKFSKYFVDFQCMWCSSIFSFYSDEIEQSPVFTAFDETGRENEILSISVETTDSRTVRVLVRAFFVF